MQPDAARTPGFSPGFIFVYGLLRPGESGLAELGLADHLPATGRAKIRGRLYDLGPYPGAKLDEPGTLAGDLLRLTRPADLDALDRFEDFDPRDLAASLYERRRVRTLASNLTVWAYHYRPAVDPEARIASGDWTRRG